MIKFLASALLLFSSLTNAASTTVTVLDSEGKPVKNAVLSIFQKTLARESLLPIAVMDQVNKQFLPRVLTITAGQSVKFPNSDNIRHHVYSFSKPKNFEIKLYSGTPSAPVIFENPGIVVLGCNIHDQMIGYIYIGQSNAEGEESMSLTNEKGQAEINLTLDGEVKVWHERLPDISTPVTLQSQQIINNGYTIKIQLNPERVEQTTPKFKRKFG